MDQDVNDYPHIPPNWYSNTTEQPYVPVADWKYVDLKMENIKIRQMKMGSKLGEEEIKEYGNLVDEFSDTFVWSYDNLKGIPQEMVEHHIPFILGARSIRQKERMMNPQM